MVKKRILLIMLGTIFLVNAHDLPLSQTSVIETTSENLNFDECMQAHNEKLKLCLKELSHKKRIQLFEKISSEQKKEVLKLLLSDLYEYEEFLDDFNEYDWHRVVTSIPSNERLYFPETIYEQRMALYVLCDPNKKKNGKTDENA